jgi:hypothetical protein
MAAGDRIAVAFANFVAETTPIAADREMIQTAFYGGALAVLVALEVKPPDRQALIDELAAWVNAAEEKWKAGLNARS